MLVLEVEVESQVKPAQREEPEMRLFWSQIRAQALNVAAWRTLVEERSLGA